MELGELCAVVGSRVPWALHSSTTEQEKPESLTQTGSSCFSPIVRAGLGSPGRGGGGTGARPGGRGQQARLDGLSDPRGNWQARPPSSSRGGRSRAHVPQAGGGVRGCPPHTAPLTCGLQLGVHPHGPGVLAGAELRDGGSRGAGGAQLGAHRLARSCRASPPRRFPAGTSGVPGGGPGAGASRQLSGRGASEFPAGASVQGQAPGRGARAGWALQGPPGKARTPLAKHRETWAGVPLYGDSLSERGAAWRPSGP